jgi:aromatic-L-amino-acid/L-tryptophan decarboxylase
MCAMTAAGTSEFDWHPEPSLVDFHDPASREPLEQLGDATWQTAMDHLYGEAFVRPVGPSSYPQLREQVFGPSRQPMPAPAGPSTSAEVLAEIKDRLLPYMYNAHHLRSFSYFTAPPLPVAVAGDVLASWLQQSVDVFHASPVGTLLDEEVTGWLRDLVGYGDEGWGVLTSGGVMANLMAMTVARDTALGRLRGGGRAPRGSALEGSRVYVSDQAHFSIRRALDVLGFPPETLHVVPSDDSFRMPAGRVAEAVTADRAAGLLPFCIAAVAGSTNTGSVDAIADLADLAEREGLWLHVDAAYGGAVRLSRRDADRVPALERADSVTVDPHKWFFQPIDVGALLVRRREDLRRSFLQTPEYYRSSTPEDEPLGWLEYSIEGTRRLRSLKLWASWRHLGTDGLGRLVEATNDLAAELTGLIAASPDFEAALPEPDLSVVCFRHLPAVAMSDAELDQHQDRLQRALEISGAAWVSTTRLHGRTWLRAGVMNYMSTSSDLVALLDALRSLDVSEPQDR